MNKGDIVKHKLSGETLRILKLSEGCAVCQHVPWTDIRRTELGIYHDGLSDRYICLIENLESNEDGKFIFDWLDTFGNRYENVLKNT